MSAKVEAEPIAKPTVPKRGTQLIIEYAFAIGTSAAILSLYAVIIIKFLRWALG